MTTSSRPRPEPGRESRRTQALLLTLVAVVGLLSWAVLGSTSTTGQAARSAALRLAPTTTSLPTTAAVWVIAQPDNPPRNAMSFTAQVVGLECIDGVAEPVLPPTVALGATTIVVTFTVHGPPFGPHTCPGNPRVPYRVDLGQPIGYRALVDGACVSGVGTAWCTPDGVRRTSDGTRPPDPITGR